MHRNVEVMKRFWIVCEECGKTLKRAIDGPISESERLAYNRRRGICFDPTKHSGDAKKYRKR